MKVKLIVDKWIRGEPAEAGDTVDVGDLCAEWLIDNKFAEPVEKKVSKKPTI